MKKAQVTAFIIIGIIVALTVVYFTFLRNTSTGIKGQDSNEVIAVNDFVQECVETSAKQAVIFTGNEGGYYANFSLSVYDSFGDNDFIIPYYFRNGSVFTPTKETVETSIQGWFNELLPMCTNDFVSFKGVNVAENEPQTEVTILENRVLFQVNYPLTIKTESKSSQISKFNTEVKAETLQMINAVNEYMLYQKDYNDGFLMSLMDETAFRNNMTYKTGFITNSTKMIVVLSKNNSLIGEKYLWKFGLEYE